MSTVSKSSPELGFLGPEGSWTHEAALTLQGVHELLVALPADELFRAYSQGSVTRICIPYHSSLVGLTPYFDQVTALARWWIERDYRRPIEHSLVALEPIDLQRVELVLGHPVALAEVAPWIERHLGHAQLQSVASGGQAIETLRRIGQKSCVAVAPAPASRAADLTLLLPCIPTRGPNVTSWWVLGARSDMDASRSDQSLWWLVRSDQHVLDSIETQLIALGCTAVEVFSRSVSKMGTKSDVVFKAPGALTDEVSRIFGHHHLDFDLVGASPF